MEKGKNNTNEKESKFVKAYHDRIQAIYEKSPKSDDLDRIWMAAIRTAKAQTIFETLHPESKEGKRTKEEGNDERFIGKNIDQIDELIDDKYDDPELIIKAYKTVRQMKTIKASDVGKAMLTDPDVVQRRKAVKRAENGQKKDTSEKTTTDE